MSQEINQEIKERADRALRILGALSTMLTGIVLVAHDWEDIGKFDHGGKFIREGDPFSVIREFIHHWFLGIILFFVGLLMLLLNLGEEFMRFMEEK